MEQWRLTWRLGFAPQLSTAALAALEKGLLEDDPALIQGNTCHPPPLEALKDRPVEACCALTYAGWHGDGVATVGLADEFFRQVCDGCDRRFSEPAATRHFIGWFDDTPRDEMRRELLAEVRLALKKRAEAEVA